MKKIKGLLLKDLIEIKSYKKNLILCIVIYGIIIMTDSDNTSIIWASMIMFLFSLYAITTFNYDEKCKTDRFLLTFPITKKDYLISKYVFCFLSTIIGGVIGLLLVGVLTYIKSKTIIDLSTVLVSMLLSVYAISLMQCIQIPAICRYGAEKGRNQIYIIIMIMMFLLSSIFAIIPKTFLSKFSILMHFIPIIVIVLIIINFLISFKVAYKIYLKREV